MKNEWILKYLDSMSSRAGTFRQAFDLLVDLPRHNIVETGCVRQVNDWGAGYSTVLFGEFCRAYGGKLISVDNTSRHIEIARELTRPWSDLITFVESDSIDFLRHYSEEIDFLYLDSMDVPIYERENRVPCQIHCLEEFKAAERKLHKDSIVLIDDYFEGDGKGRLLRGYLNSKGWKCIGLKQQELFIRI